MLDVVEVSQNAGVDLNLRVHVLDGQDMEALGRLPKLRYLKLHTEYDGIVLVSGDKIIPGDGYL